MLSICQEITNPPKEQNTIANMCGYVPDSEEKVLMALKYWNAFLPKEYRDNLRKIALRES